MLVRELVHKIRCSEREGGTRGVESSDSGQHILFSINLGIPKVKPRATKAIRIMGFLNKARGETKSMISITVSNPSSVEMEKQGPKATRERSMAIKPHHCERILLAHHS